MQLHIALRNVRAFLAELARRNKGVNTGRGDGVRRATAMLARDVAAHTPVKTGRARRSVVERVSPSGAVGRVRYDYKKRAAWYMRVIILGTYKKPSGYPIGLKYKTAKALARANALAARRAARSGKPAPVRKTKKKALAIKLPTGQVIFRASVKRHPGIRGRNILQDRLRAMAPQLARTIGTSVAQRAKLRTR